MSRELSETELTIGSSTLGGSRPLFTIAEIGLNHGGSMDRAIALVDAAAAAGASAVKLQVLIANELVGPSSVAPAHVQTASLQEFFATFELEEAEYRLFNQGEFVQHVWYWHLYDGRVIHPEGVRSPRQLLMMALKYGFHREGEQLFVRVSSNQPWETIATEPLLQEIFARLAPFGL